jgi:hypothetical protein
MTAKEQVLNAIENMGPLELLRVADFIEALQPAELTQTKAPNGADYRAVREALSGLTVPMSVEVERGREDRI